VFSNDLDTLRLVTRERSERFTEAARAESLAKEARETQRKPRMRRSLSWAAAFALLTQRAPHDTETARTADMT
jgi:hypothetical protein